MFEEKKNPLAPLDIEYVNGQDKKGRQRQRQRHRQIAQNSMAVY